MPRITFYADVTDEMFANFMTNIGGRAVGADAPANGDEDAGPVNPNAPAVDSAGVPWIEAVHSAQKTTNENGTWRGKRGVDKATRTAYENQARTVAAGQAQPSAQIPAGATPIAPPLSAMSPSAFPPVAQPAAFPPVVAPVAAAPITYQDVADKFQAAVAAGRMQPAQFADWYGEMGINDPAQLSTNESARVVAMRKLKQVMGEPV